MPKLSLDVLKVQDAHRAGQAVTDRPVRLRREVKTKAFESPALTERLERDPSERDRGIDAVKMGPAIRQQLPTWFRTTKKGVGFLTSDQSLKQIVRGAIVPRGHSQENFEGNRVQSQRWTSKIPRTTSSQLFKGHDPVDEQTFGKSNERAQSLGGVDRATAGRRIPRDLSKKRKNVDVIVDIWPESQQYDRLGLPKILQQPQGQSTYLSGMRPGTNSRPRTSGRPAMQARMARRAERQRLEDMPEPIIHQHVQSIDDREKNNPRSVLQRLVEISSAEQDVIDSYVPEVLDAAANLCQQNQYAEAERLYRAVVAYSPQNIAARCNLGVIMERLHDNPVAAAEMYQSALDASGGKDVSCLLHLARSTYRTASDISKPRALLQKVLGIDPTHYGALNCMALLLLSEWIRSHSQLDRLATMDPSSLSEFLVLQSKQNQDPLRKTFSNTLFRTKSTDTDQVSGIQRSHSSSSQSSNANKGSTFVAEALKSATEAVKLSETFFWKAHDSAKTHGDRSSMALALGNIATIQKMVFKDPLQAERLYKQAIECDPCHPVLRRNFARLYHDYFNDKVDSLTAVLRGQASKETQSKGRHDRTAAQLGRVAEAEYRTSLELCKTNGMPKELSGEALKLDICINLAGLLSEEAMGQRLSEAKTFYQMAHECDTSNLKAALGYAAILWERENRLQEAEVVMRSAIQSNEQKKTTQKRWKKVRRSLSGVSKFLSTKADRIEVKEQDNISTSLLTANIVNLADFEGKSWELKASSVYLNLDKFSAAGAFDTDEGKEWATANEKAVGQWVYVKYTLPYIVSVIKIKQRKAFAQMVRKLGIYFDGGEHRELLLLPETHEQDITFDPPIISSVVRLEIMQTYGDAHSGLNTVQVFGQHRSAAELALKYDQAAKKLQILKEQTHRLGDKQLEKEEDQLATESYVMHAKLLLAGEVPAVRDQGVQKIFSFFDSVESKRPLQPELFSSAVSAYGAYVQTCTLSVPKSHAWMPFQDHDPPRLQSEQLFELALEVYPPNVDAQLRLAISFNQRLIDCMTPEHASWSRKAEEHYQTVLLKDPTNVMALYCYANYLQEYMDDLNQAIELYRRAVRSFCVNKLLQASVLCSLATALQRRGRLSVISQANIFSVHEDQDEQSLIKPFSRDAKPDVDKLSHMNDLDEAALWYERSLAMNGRNVACLCNYGMLQQHRNYARKALRHFSRAIHIEPYNAKALATFAAALDDAGAGLNVVENMYVRAVKQDPNYVLALNGLGTVAHRMQKWGEAEDYYKSALLIEPTNEDITENLSILREATYGQHSPKVDRSLLRSRERALISSRERRVTSRIGLQSRDGPAYMHERPSSRDLSSLMLGGGYTHSMHFRSRLNSPLVSSVALAEDFGFKHD